MRIALAGNPNSGKTTLFNALTGANQYVGNWPGVTVEKKEGRYKGNKDINIIDLPGVYSLSPYSLEEVIARNYILDEKPDGIINLVDGSNLERNLYLTTQLKDLNIPMVVAVNMADVIEKRGDKINIDVLSQEMGVKFVLISAVNKTNINDAVDLLVKEVNDKNKPGKLECLDKEIEEKIAEVEKTLSVDSFGRFFAIKLLERDEKIKDKISSTGSYENLSKSLEDK